jgi:hypothetical protein
VCRAHFRSVGNKVVSNASQIEREGRGFQIMYNQKELHISQRNTGSAFSEFATREQPVESSEKAVDDALLRVGAHDADAYHFASKSTQTTPDLDTLL